MIRFFKLWILAIKTSLANWVFTLPIFIGILITTFVLAASPLYFNALQHLALKFDLNQVESGSLDVLLLDLSEQTNFARFSKLTEIVRDEYSNLNEYFLDLIHGVKTETFDVIEGVEQDDDLMIENRAFFFYSPLFLEKIRFAKTTDSSFTGENITHDKFPELKVAMPYNVAQHLGIDLGSRMKIRPFIDEYKDELIVEVVAFFEPNDPTDSFWYFYEKGVLSGTVLTVNGIPLFVDKETYFNDIPKIVGPVKSRFVWFIDLNHENFIPENMDYLLNQLTAKFELINNNSVDLKLETALFTVWKDSQNKLFFKKIPILIFLFILAILVIYYVITISYMLADSRKRDLLLLQVRGSTLSHIILLTSMESITFAIFSIAVIPFVVIWILSSLTYLPVFREFTKGSTLSLEITPLSWGLAFLGGILCALAMVLTNYVSWRNTLRELQSTLGSSRIVMAFQKYQIDTILLLFIFLLFWQLKEQGSVLLGEYGTERYLDQFSLIIPGLLLLAGSLLILKVFPLLVWFIQILSKKITNPSINIALINISRDSGHYSRLTMLFVLVSGFAIFASSFIATIELNFIEREKYRVGAEIRLENVQMNNIGFSSRIEDEYLGIFPKNANLTGVFRGAGTVFTTNLADEFNILGVDPMGFKSVSWWRKDFAKFKLDNLSSFISSDDNFGLPVPLDTKFIRIKYKPSISLPETRLLMRVRDVKGRYFDYFVGYLGKADVLGNKIIPDWQKADIFLDSIPKMNIEPNNRDKSFEFLKQSFGLSSRGIQCKDDFSNIMTCRSDKNIKPSEPLSIVSFGVRAPFFLERLKSGSVSFDSIKAISFISDSKGGLILVENSIEEFNDTSKWHFIKKDIGESIKFDRTQKYLNLNWKDTPTQETKGIYFHSNDYVVPVLIDETFSNRFGFKAGDYLETSFGFDRNRKMNFQVTEVIEYFPTMYFNDSPFVVGDIDNMLHAINLTPGNTIILPNELWVKGDGIEKLDPQIDLYEEPLETKFVFLLENFLSKNILDPLAKTGWLMLLYFSFGVIACLGCIAFLVHSHMSFEKKKWQFALLQTLGFSKMQIIFSVFLEQIIFIVFGLLLGSFAGRSLVSIVLPFIEYDQIGMQIIPSFSIVSDFMIMLYLYIIISVMIVLVSLLGLGFVSNRTINNMMRLGDRT